MAKGRKKPENDKAKQGNGHDAEMANSTPITGMYEDWFLEYASYVILDRAVPYIEDGLKPVQRRILHAMKELDDGRYNKVANIIGTTMQFHPHGDAAIGDAIVNLGQKELLIDTQGNWGNVATGDNAAAPRYIEARLSKFASHVVFNPKTTEWQLSYDGRKNEPVTLPVKFPLVLAQGIEGIAVGLSTKILPHNFIELCEASIAYLKGRSFKLFPDFAGGGMVDVEHYNNGQRGGKVRVRCNIEMLDKKTLKIADLPYNVTTSTLIDSILKANEKGKIKIKKIDDNTARNVEILIHLPSGVSADITIDALYAFTNCEVSISPNTCIIIEDNPHFTNVRDVLKLSTDKTKALLKLELQIRKKELEEKWHLSSLEKIFIENRIYRDIEECETWEAVIDTIDKGLKPFKKLLKRTVTRDDIVRLTEIKIKRISKFDSFKADELIKGIEDSLKEVNFNLKNLTDYSVNYFKELIEKFGEGRERKTELKTFDTIEAKRVSLANVKLYVNAADGFVGTSLKKDDFIGECSDLDDVIAFKKDGTMMVTKVGTKTYVGKGIIYAGVFKRSDDRMVYHMIYFDKQNGKSYVKRFQVLGVTRDKDYMMTKGKKGGRVVYLSANPNGESEVVTVYLKHQPRIRTQFDFDFEELTIKGRSSGGNLISKYEVRKAVQKSKGVSTLGGREIWYEESLKRLNTDGNGLYLGNFQGEDQVIALYDDGSYELTNFDLTNRYEGKGKMLEIAKLTNETVVSAIHLDGETDVYFVKRFGIETTTSDQKFPFINESKGSKLIYATLAEEPIINIIYAARKKRDRELEMAAFIEVKGWKATGNKLTEEKIKSVELLSYLEDVTEGDEPEIAEEESSKKNIDESPSARKGAKGKSSGKEIPFEVVDTRENEDDPTLFD